MATKPGNTKTGLTRVGFIGLGHMGSLMAANVIKGGFDLMAYDVRREAVEEVAKLGARPANSPAEVGAHSEVIEVAVRNDAQVQSVFLEEGGVLSGAAPGTVIAIHSTIHPKTVKRVAEEAEKKGVVVIDAQMSGGDEGVRKKTLSFMVGGDAAHTERCRPLFEASGGGPIFHMGELGTAAAAKLAQQVIIVGTMMAVTEGMLLAKKAGIELEAFAEFVRSSSGSSHVADRWLDWFSKLEPHRVRGLCEALAPAFDLAHELEVPLPSLGVARHLLPLRMPAG